MQQTYALHIRTYLSMYVAVHKSRSVFVYMSKRNLLHLLIHIKIYMHKWNCIYKISPATHILYVASFCY